jgi:cytochrome c peroxidase
MHFYVERDTDPGRWYPTINGRPVKFNDLPTQYRGNVNISDAPLNRERGQAPALNEQEIKQVIAFLGTLTDAD